MTLTSLLLSSSQTLNFPGMLAINRRCLLPWNFCSQVFFFFFFFLPFPSLEQSQSSWEMSKLFLVLRMGFHKLFSSFGPRPTGPSKGFLILRLEKEKSLCGATYLHACPIPARTLGTPQKTENPCAHLVGSLQGIHCFSDIPAAL